MKTFAETTTLHKFLRKAFWPLISRGSERSWCRH